MILFRHLLRWAARLAARLRTHARLLQLLLAGVALGLGFWGWSIKAPATDLAGQANNLFRTLQLITLQFPTQFDSGLPWQLHVARLLVPVSALAASLHIVIGAATRPARLALMPYASGHIILCGSDQLTRAALATLAEDGRRQVVTVGPAIDPGRREALEGIGLTLVEGDPGEAVTLAALGLPRAAALFVTGDDDVANLNIAMTAIRAAGGQVAGKPPLDLAVLVDDEELARELDAALDGLSRAAGLRYHRLCPDREGLRLELRHHAPVFHKPDREERAHVLVLGLAGRWQQALTQLIVSAQDHPHLLPLLTLVLSPAEEAALEAWRAERPALSLIVEFAVLPAGTRHVPSADGVADWAALHRPPHLAVVLRPDAEGLGTALALRRPGCRLRLPAEAPILVRQSREDHLLPALGEGVWGRAGLRHLIPFGGLLRAESIARVLDHAGEEMAMALHAAYQQETAAPGSPESLAAWDLLPENLRDANRASADHVPVMLAANGLVQAQAGDPAVLSEEEIERMARIEHRRWIADRIERGWRYGPRRDDAMLLHPSLRDYDALDDAEQEKDRRQVRTLLRLASAGGPRVVRR